jgi:hypothetical protein
LDSEILKTKASWWTPSTPAESRGSLNEQVGAVGDLAIEDEDVAGRERHQIFEGRRASPTPDRDFDARRRRQEAARVGPCRGSSTGASGQRRTVTAPLEMRFEARERHGEADAGPFGETDHAVFGDEEDVLASDLAGVAGHRDRSRRLRLQRHVGLPGEHVGRENRADDLFENGSLRRREFARRPRRVPRPPRMRSTAANAKA